MVINRMRAAALDRASVPGTSVKECVTLAAGRLGTGRCSCVTVAEA